MSDTAWGWFLLAAELVGLVAMSELVGKRRRAVGFVAVFAAVSVPWVVYSITTARWSFLVLSILWAAVHLTNAYRWGKHDVHRRP